MSRPTLPRKAKDAILAEYSHRCAMCGSTDPHIHHIDEDHSNNTVENLLPLCPNCHLRDQHNPTRKVEVPKLKLFRQFKDLAILKPQFHPIYTRQLFLGSIDASDEPITELDRQARELVDLVEALEMGALYAKRMHELLAFLPQYFVMRLSDGPDPEYEKQRRDASRLYRDQLRKNAPIVQALLIEQLRYQAWANEA